MATKRKQLNIEEGETDEPSKKVIKSKKARLSVTVPKWVKESMGQWIDCEQFPSESELTGIGMACFLFMLENNAKTSASHNDIQILQNQIEEIQKTLELIVKNLKPASEQK